ncbi:MAG: hypothetical protein QXZ40_02215 [Candidatus Micrarchaeia archaeon]
MKKFACSTCLAVMESIEEQPQVLPEITKITKINKKEVLECLRFAEENMLVSKQREGYVLNEKGKEALRRFRDISPLVCEP